MKIEHKTFAAEVKKFDDENLIVEHFISTEHKDRGGDVMRAKGMKIVGKPVVLLLHGRGPMGSEPIGKPLSITVDEFKGQPGILAKTQFFPDEVGQRLYRKVKEGFLPNWSIGYAVDEAKDILEAGKWAGRDVTKWQLLEYSPVGVPMNPFAQTIKEFLDDVEAGREVKNEEGSWFGLIDEADCKGCGACGCGKEKKAEEEAPPAPPAEETPSADPMKALEERVKGLEEQLRALMTMNQSALESLEAFGKSIAKLEPLLKTLPPEPDGGEKGSKQPPENPPEQEKKDDPPRPPRLVILREEESPSASAKAAILSVLREVLGERAQQEIDRMRGRVH
jgi:hypothetical protein